MWSVWSPHLALAAVCAAYILMGAFVLRQLEGDNLRNVKAQRLAEIDERADAFVDRIWELAANRRKFHPKTSKEDEAQESRKLVEFIRAATRDEWDEYVDSVFIAHRAVRHGYDEDAPEWDFAHALFFTTTMLTSIGYGFVAPTTFAGRLFVVLYCLIGIPLTLVTVANIAKFISETLFLVHYEAWRLWMRWREKRRESADLANSLAMFDEEEDEQEILDRVRLVRFPPFLVFGFVLVYGLLASLLVQWGEPEWSYLESAYFIFISILTVGFGDYRPSKGNLGWTCVIILGGVVLTTMCMDVVGRMYLKEIHYLGRKIQSNNPFHLLREAKARRRRAAMAGLLANLAKGMIFAHRDLNEISRWKSKRKSKRRGTKTLPDDTFLFARQPPDPPTECQVVSTSAYSVRLAWNPAFSGGAPAGDVTYNIRYRLKHKESAKPRWLRGVRGNAAEIMAVESCSLYEFRISAVSRYGESKPIYLVQYTEPQLSPQHILATRLSANTVELSWEPPFKRRHQVLLALGCETTECQIRHYVVYYTETPDQHFSHWEQTIVHGRRVVFPGLRFDWFYMFCAAVVFADGQRSPLSRALFIKTDKLAFQPSCVGHSKTVEVMQSLWEVRDEKAHADTLPLLKRDYASFAV